MARDTMNKVMSGSGNEQLKTLAAQLTSSDEVRRKFLDNPAEVLRGHGVELGTKVQLGPREKLLIELFTDPKVTELYTSGDIDALREHIVSRHRDLVGSPLDEVAGIAVADFDVAIEAEVVAVAVVAVAAVAIGAVDAATRLKQVEADAGVLNARLAGLEAKLKMMDVVEARMNALEKRIR